MTWELLTLRLLASQGLLLPFADSLSAFVPRSLALAPAPAIVDDVIRRIAPLPLVLRPSLPSLGQHIQLDVRRAKLALRQHVRLLLALTSRGPPARLVIRDVIPPRDGALNTPFLLARS